MAYTPRPTLKNTLPNEGFFFLKEPIKCSDGTFEAGSVVRISAVCFNEADHIAEYKIYSLNESEIISDKYYFRGNDTWDDVFVPLNDNEIASKYYNSVGVLHEKEADIDCKHEILSFVTMIIMPIATLFLLAMIIGYFGKLDESLTLVGTIACIIASVGVIVVPIVIENNLIKRKNNIIESIRQYELNSFFDFEGDARWKKDF